MKSSKDKYNFDQPSPAGQFGFETFKSEIDDKYYFHFNNQKGKPTLFSQAYASARSRDNGLNSVQTNATDITRFSFQEEEDQFFFTLIAGNNQEIAHSTLFDTKEEMEIMMAQVIEFATHLTDQPKAEEKQLNEAKEEASQKRSLPSHEGMAPTKSRITIDFYRNKSGAPLKGRIEHPLSGDKVNFQGVNHNVILQFIEQHIPSGENQRPPMEQATKAIVAEDLSGIHALNKGLKTQFIPMGDSFELKIPLPEEAQGYSSYNLEVFAKKLGRSQKTPIGHDQSKLSKTNNIVYSINNCPLSKDTYRLLVNLSLSKDNEKEQIETLKGSCLLLIQ